jgi:hypothetical protein
MNLDSNNANYDLTNDNEATDSDPGVPLASSVDESDYNESNLDDIFEDFNQILRCRMIISNQRMTILPLAYTHPHLSNVQLSMMHFKSLVTLNISTIIILMLRQAPLLVLKKI